ncbi:MAG: NADH-quinone oxidoreductase subunit H [Candidatus Wildermuthbacteria bacterium]|nr:NADH-quinone oxidoreductase subunit H [Candidatus Wildermuthbacteria bacterium]
MTAITFSIIQALLLSALSPLLIGVIRKIKARMQNRVGASVFQPYRDIIKLLHKDEIISEEASWIFRFAPYLIFTSTLLVSMGIPILTTLTVFAPAADFLVFIYVIALGTFFLALAGMDTGSSFGGFGSSREMTVAALAEAGLLFSLLSVALIAHSTNFGQIVANIQLLPLVSLVPVFIAFVAFLIALVAETSRMPIDNPSTHLELTMIHEAMILEYSGKRLALIEWAASNKLLIFVALAANLFFPWGIAQDFSLQALMLAFAIFAVKVFLIGGGIAFVESVIAKLRFFRIPDLLLTSLVLGIIAIGIIMM